MKLYKNWVVHNLISHPLSEIIFWMARPFVSQEKAENIAGAIHDSSIPDHIPGTGRG